MIEVLFTKSAKIGSLIIRDLTGEDCSHCALFEPDTGMVIHASFTGIAELPIEEFLRDHEIVHHLELPSIEVEDLHFPLGRGYDFFGLIYLGLRFSLKKIGIEIPKANLFNVSGLYLCTEFVSLEILGKADSDITPGQLYLKLKG